MEIVKNHYLVSKEVKNYREIKSIARDMSVFLDGGIKKGEYTEGFALAHCQVEDENPLAFFVVNTKHVGKLWEHMVIMNPEILKAPATIKKEDGTIVSNRVSYIEGCFSFPFRQPKSVERYFRIKVRYYIPGRFWMRKIERWIEGLPAHIFQHEEQHCRGKNIYFNQ